MKVLIIGQGGREHALVKFFRRSASITEIHVAPGNDGMAKEALCHNLSWKDSEEIIGFCLRTEIDFVFIGPEEPLVGGLADRLRERGILVVGPSGPAAQLEGSKIFAKEFMLRAGVPTARSVVVASVSETIEASRHFKPPYVLKADGLAAGKGVSICANLGELTEAAKDLFENKIFGLAGSRALLEECLEGWELSYLILTNGNKHMTLPLAQDHKRLRDKQQGPNTGGMGTVAPIVLEHDLFEKIESQIIRPSVKQLGQEGLIFRGVLFVGIMVTQNGPVVLEYNTRFGDPETQVILPLIENDAGVLFKKLSQGELEPVIFNSLFSCCVILAAEGYPEAPKKDILIEGDLWKETNSSYFIHAGTKREKSQWLTNGGRVLGAVGVGSSFNEAIRNAYQQAQEAKWPGQQLRTDIGKSCL
ncbi:MAG: phosphoribosylamine--glycine ligase [Bdellovibrionales bacterium]|nr:phosphoribosylamine--glycine ligase [Bdellovibrionales bacterium]